MANLINKAIENAENDKEKNLNLNWKNCYLYVLI